MKGGARGWLHAFLNDDDPKRVCDIERSILATEDLDHF